VSSELETAAAEAVPHLIGRRRRHAPEPGAVCANCDTPLQGPYCYACGQDSDTHKRSILHLGWEAIEGLLHLDGRLLRTVPLLFLHPGRLARDYMEGRIVRHTPPFRTFLVALLLFIFAAEYASHRNTEFNARQEAARAALLKTPQGRASESARLRAEAVKERDADLAEAAHDRDDDLKDPDANRPKTLDRYQRAVERVQARYAVDMDRADRVAQGLPPPTKEETLKRLGLSDSEIEKPSWWKDGLHKATANPEYYMMVLFTWAHRVAVLLLPIMGLSLALVYFTKRRYFIYDHLLVAMDLLSFAFLTNAVALVLPAPLTGWALGVATLWWPVNLFQTLRGAYGSSVVGALLKTAIVWTVTVFSFACLLTGLLVFSLTQL
jgi:hypothetical protein